MISSSHAFQPSANFPEGELAADMVAGINRFLMRETEASIERRAQFWQRDFSSWVR